MGSTVLAQVAFTGKSFGTNGATERFDSAVQLEMRFTVFLSSEPFGAHGARVWPITRVRSHVNVEIPTQCEFLATTGLRAGKPTALRVNANMALQVAETGKGLVASIAAKRTGG